MWQSNEVTPKDRYKVVSNDGVWKSRVNAESRGWDALVSRLVGAHYVRFMPEPSGDLAAHMQDSLWQTPQ